MQNTLRIAKAMGLPGKPEEQIAKVRELFETNNMPTEFKKGAAVQVNGVALVDDKGAPLTGSAIRAAADELGIKLVVTANWVA